MQTFHTELIKNPNKMVVVMRFIWS